MADGGVIGASTDNFAISEFELNGHRWYSAEHAYQGMKMKRKADTEKIAACSPKKGEKSWDYGMRVWNMGQRGTKRSDWEKVKVHCMYEANKAKLEQSPELAKELCLSEGLITHRGSGAFWDEWNPVLLMLIREELRGEEGDPGVAAKLCAMITSGKLAKLK